MSPVVSLGQARKGRARAEAKTAAAQNRVKFGRTKAQKALAAARADKARSALDQAKRED